MMFNDMPILMVILAVNLQKHFALSDRGASAIAGLN